MAPLSRSKPQQQSRNQSKTKARTSERPAERPASRESAQPIAERVADKQAEVKQAQGLKMEQSVVAAGRAGERNIEIDWFFADVEGHRPCGFNVRTLPDHGLEVVMEQRSYRKTYTGTGALTTSLAPIAPIGTKGLLLVTDTTTSETFEQPWTWRIIGGGFSGLWAAIKRFLWNG